MVFSTTACASNGAQHTKADPYQLVQPGVITAATQTTQPPFAMAGSGGQPAGFAVDLMNEAAKRLHMKVQYKITDLQGVLSGLSANQYDIGVAGFGVTPEREKTVTFTTPFYWGFTAVVTKNSVAQRALADFDGTRVGVVSGSVQEAFAVSRMPKAQIVKFSDQSAMIAQLLSGGVDGVVLGGADAQRYVDKQPLRIAATADSLQGSAFPLRKNGDPKLLKDIDAQIDAQIDDGTYLRLYQKYFKDRIAAALIKARPKLAKQVQGTELAPAVG